MLILVQVSNFRRDDRHRGRQLSGQVRSDSEPVERSESWLQHRTNGEKGQEVHRAALCCEGNGRLLLRNTERD
ncbi:hypothetical protein HMI54_014023 [Coelomomyces lativittatus]|nr:hypothetical protein HMI54_014023 [Coelomomyces lativittatus]